MKELYEVKEIFDKISSISSTNSKKVIIKQNEDNELFLEMLKFTLDDNIVTNLSTKKMQKKVDDSFIDINDVRGLMKYLQYECSGTDRNIADVKEFINSQDEELHEFLNKFVTKKLRLGVKASLVNKVIPGFIQTHDIMLADRYDGTLKQDVSVSLKEDGVHGSIVYKDGKYVMMSRQGQIINGLDYILDEYIELNLCNYFIDGEIVRVNNDNIPSDENFRLTTKLVNSKKDIKHGLEFVVFDITLMEDYIKGNSLIPYIERLELMNTLIGYKGEYIRVVNNYGITRDENEINNRLDEVVNEGKEGLVLNALDGVYRFGKRSKDVLKVKKFSEADMLVADVFEGDGKLKGTLGGIVVEGLYNGELIKTKVGSGFDDKTRNEIFKNPEEIIGKIVVIKYFQISEDAKTKIKSLRYPIWKNVIRNDKSGIKDTNIE